MKTPRVVQSQSKSSFLVGGVVAFLRWMNESILRFTRVRRLFVLTGKK